MNIFQKIICIIRFKLLKHRLLKFGEVHYINGSETLPAPLKKNEEELVMKKLAEGDESARETLITHNLRLVVYIAKKFESKSASVEDLISIGTIGLIKAVRTFNPEKNIKLATYASRCIENEILMFLRKSSQQKNEISIDEPLNVDWDGNELLISDILSCDEDSVNCNIERESEHKLLLKAVSRLSGREREIMELRFGLMVSASILKNKLQISWKFLSPIYQGLKKDNFKVEKRFRNVKFYITIWALVFAKALFIFINGALITHNLRIVLFFVLTHKFMNDIIKI